MNTNTSHHNALDSGYLTKQNRKLRMQLAQAIKLKELHQQVLIQINQQYPQSSIIKTLVEIINRTASENSKNKQNQYIMELEAKMMVLEKISQQTQHSQKQTYNLLAQQFKKLKEENAKISQQLHKFYEKIGEVDYISGLVTKYKQLLTPTQQTMAFKKQQQQLLDALNIQQETIKRVSQQRDKLMRINVYMKEEVERKKDEVRNMTMMFINGHIQDDGDGNVENVLDQLEEENHNSNSSNPNSYGKNINKSNQNSNQQQHMQVPMSDHSSISTKRANLSKLNTSLLQQNNPNTTLNFIKMQRQLLKDVQQQSQANSSFTNQSDCPQLTILFPDKVQKIMKTKQQSKVPYLNMKKVRQMMAKREEKMRKQWEQQNHHINPTNKIIQLQTQLDITRKQLANQSLKFRLMVEELKRLRVSIQELEKRNQLLVESNYRLKSNYQMIYKDYQLCKSITMEVERVLGMVVGKDNEQKVRERLAVLLGNKLQVEQRNSQLLSEKGKNAEKNKRQKSQNTHLSVKKKQEEQENSLELTFQDQMRMRRLMDIFGQQKCISSSNQMRRALSK